MGKIWRNLRCVSYQKRQRVGARNLRRVIWSGDKNVRREQGDSRGSKRGFIFDCILVDWAESQGANFLWRKAIERKVAVIESPTFIVFLDDAKRVPNTYLKRHQLDRYYSLRPAKQSNKMPPDIRSFFSAKGGQGARSSQEQYASKEAAVSLDYLSTVLFIPKREMAL